MMATSHTFPPEESLPHPPPNFQPQQINTKQVIYNKSGTKCMNIVKDPSGMPLSPTSPSTRDQNDSSPSHNPQNNNEADIQVNGTHNNHIKTNYNSENEEEALDVDLEDEDEFFSDDDGYDPEAPEIPFPRKDSIANHDDIHHNHPHHNHNHKSRKDGIWNTNNNEERQRIREFWLQLGEEERRSLVKVEKEAVLKKMKEQQKHSCSLLLVPIITSRFNNCLLKSTELETLYDAYYEELESYANHQQQFGSSNIEYRNDADEHDSDTRKEFFNNFGNSLTVKGGILTVADDLLKNDGKKFLEMMERLAERRMQREEDESAMDQEQRMEEGRRMFQIFAARMFEQRVLNAYREKVAQERQQKLLEEALKQQKEEERARREAERLAEEKAQRAEREKKLEEERKRREEERLKKEAERRQREEERQRKEEEKRRKAREEREREERRKKEQEAKERKEKEKEERERKEREEKARKEKEERRQREERERKQRELKEKEHREEKERKEREEKQKAVTLRQQQHHERKRTITPIGQPSAQPPPPPSISTPVIQNKPVVSMPNGMNWINYSSHEQHQPLPQHSINPQHVINSHLPPPPNHPNHPPPHPLFNPGGPQPQFGGQPVGIMNGPAGMTNEVANEVFTNTKKAINPPPQGTNTLQGINPTSSLFATGLGPIGMGVHPHHGGPPVPIHAHQVMRQQMPPPRGFNPIAPTPHLPGPSGVPPSVASTNLSLLNEAAVMSGNGNIGAGVTGNPQNGAFGGLPICGQGPLGPQTFNLGTQVPASSHIGPSVVVPNTPLAPIGHRRMSQHPEDSHVKAVQRPQPIQRPRRNSGTGQSLEIRTRSPPPGFGNMVGSGALLGDDKTNSMTNRRQSLAAGESSYFSNSLFSTAMPGGDNEWPPIRGRQNVTDNLLGESSLWYSEGNNNPTNRRVMGSRDFGIP
ncbi:7528_t:CDS:10 [Rhizophagus irregularis]|nr:7528_t:CDS:10 [Rhizophagus irregularis]